MKLSEANAQLDFVNKLIFVKEYKRAQDIIEELITSEHYATDPLVHLRRIELGTKLNSLENLLLQYQAEVEKSSNNNIAKICSVLVQQHGEMIDPEDAIAEFQSIMKSDGPHAAIYYGIAFSLEMTGNFERALYNYQQCTNLDHNWYPSYFGISQIHYNMGEDEKGDHYFFLFEELAPYNVYGNFETHRKLSQEFVQKEEYDLAIKSIVTLSEWWMENKGYCPLEIQIYERYATGHIFDIQGKGQEAEQRRNQASLLVGRALESSEESEAVLYFIAKTLEEFSELEMALSFYKEILGRESSNPDMIQKIGSQFISMGEYDAAKEIFDVAYENNADHPEIRFCWLVSKLRHAGVNIEEYLIDKERLHALLNSQSDKVELLSLLHALLAKYSEDPDVHSHIGDIYLRIGNEERAQKHFETMYALDGRSLVTKLKYASFIMQIGELEKSKEILDGISNLEKMPKEQKMEFLWLRSTLCFQAGEFQEASDQLNRVLHDDPWNVAYLVQQALVLSELNKDKVSFGLQDSVLKKLEKNEEQGLDWAEFNSKSVQISQSNLLELSYCRSKIRFLYVEDTEQPLLDLVHAACKLDASKSTYDFLKLLNTNFDSPNIYWALGRLYKELWQLEAASIWFEQVLIASEATDVHKSKAYQELADCYNWRGQMHDRAIEYAKIALDMSHGEKDEALLTLAHSLLMKGEVRQAEVYLEELEPEEPEVRYLRGLVNYRNGLSRQANEIWKPLLTLRSESLRIHTIKQQVMKYYFDKEPYKTIN